MPNWVYSTVEIDASIEDVMPYFTKYSEDMTEWCFDTVKIYERELPANEDEKRAWLMEHVGSKWSPFVNVSKLDEHTTKLEFRSARTAVSYLMLKFSEVSGFKIHQKYECEVREFEGELVAKDGIALIHEFKELPPPNRNLE